MSPMMTGRSSTTDVPERPHLVSVADAAAFLSVTPRTVRRYLSMGLITPYRIGPRLVRVDLDELRQRLSASPAPSP